MRRTTKVGLSAFMLFCHVAAEVIKVEEKASAFLPCPHPVRGGIWSRDVDGKEVNILTAGDRDIKHMEDPHRRYSSQADKSLHILRVTTSDSGTYFCNGEAVELIVIPPGTAVREAEEGTRVTLTCPPDDGPQTKTWSTAHTGAITGQQGFHVSPADQTLTITSVKMNHSGLYNCDGKPAVYLHVTKGETTTCEPKTSVTTDSTTTKKKGRNKNKTTTTSTSRRQETRTSAASTPGGGDTSRTPFLAEGETTTCKPKTSVTTDSTTTKKKGRNTNKTTISTSRRQETRTSAASTPGGGHTERDSPPGLVLGRVSPIIIVIIIIIIIIVFAWRRRLKRRGRAETCNIYEEIQERPVMTSGGGSRAGTTASYSKAEWTDLPQLPENLYCLLEKPKEPAKNTDGPL